MKKPNIILLMCDQFRGDCLSFLNHPDVKTPYLDTLASDGVCFTNAYSACPSCIPARAALFTGKSQTKNRRVGYQDGVVWNYDHMLAEELKNHNYQTACVGKMHVHPPRLSCGFETLKLHDGYIGHYRKATLPYWMHQNVCDDYMRDMKNQLGQTFDVNGSGVENNSWITHPWIYEERYHPTNWVVDESIRFLETRDRTRPYFLMTSFVRPHPPFDAPASYFDIYKNKELAEPVKSDWMNPSLTQRDGKIMDNIHGCSDKALQHDAMAGYYASITHIDHQIGRLITALENDETYDDTIIIFTSDHGEMLFDHCLFRKVLPYEGSTHIPLLVHVGKNIAKINPHVHSGIVELRDIMPTLLSFADIEIPNDLDGISLKDAICDDVPLQRLYLHGEHSGNQEQSNQWIISDHCKYIWFTQTGVEQFFDLKHDPKETHNLIYEQDNQARIQKLKNLLIQELKDREEGYSDGSQLIIGKTPVTLLTK
ncbi:arylsulfatase [Absiella sp. AM29-15]|uniref:arylsulfatase n=1 Tax=Absiella sp. AM29-15 TaxID=2292278 RepID=UPI000E42C4CB|nr:arylsulfatase [Absiella sp. AM29-15]RGC44329.1 arylsulfatase [Absiella sp. AM29-15]